jgi:tetratricopeptide (TPR) repeat protein
VQGLKVTARTSAFHFKGKDTPIPEIARQLGVAYVIEGSVRKAGDKVRITAQLIKAVDGFHVWSDTFTRDLKDVFAVQDEVAGLIGQNLKINLGAVPSESKPTSVENYDMILRARHFARQESNEGWRRAIETYREALRKEPGMAPAWAGMADAYVQLGRFNGMPNAEAMGEARKAALRALELAPEEPLALAAMGWVARNADWNWRAARGYFARSLRAQPGNGATLSASAILELNLGRSEAALALARQAVVADPLNAGAHFALATIYNNQGRPADAVPFYRRAIALAPSADEYHCLLATVHAMMGNHDEAQAELSKEPHPGYRLVGLAACAALRGDKTAAARARAELIANHANDFPGYIAEVCAVQGDMEGALEWVERAITARDNSVPWLKNLVWLAPLGENPRWLELLRRVGLADDQLK